jgi:choline dehydrogenase
MDAPEYDYIVVGAGTAGCLLANRLSADPSISVLVVEAGGPDRYPWIHIPAGYLYCIGNPKTDWCYTTASEEKLGFRQLPYARGKTLGGSSSINAMIYMRGHAENYEHWKALGNPGWGWADVLPFFLRHEDFFRGANDHHRSGGEWRVEPQRLSWPILDALLNACEELGIRRTEDFNTGDNCGASYFQVNQRKGLRLNAAKAFLHPVRHRRNLTLITNAHVTRLEVAAKRACALQFERDGALHRARARREIVLAAGSLNTPHVLELSGIGDPDSLRKAGIEVVHPLPGVGNNLIDHLQVRVICQVENAATLNTRASTWAGKLGIGLEYALFRRGPLTMAPSQAGAFCRSGDSRPAPDIHINFQPLSLDRFGEPLHRFPAITISLSNVQPSSRGWVHASDPTWRSAPVIKPNYLSTDDDQDRASGSIDLARRLLRTSAMHPYRPREFRPGPRIATREEVMESIQDISGTIFHPCGTARMGIDPMSVVDSALRVRGIAGLRVVDASVIPSPVSGGLAAPTLMIAEKGAEMILSDLRDGRSSPATAS